jgi:hypothetical protein
MGDARPAVVSDGSGMYQLQLWAPTDLEHARAFPLRHRARVQRDGGAVARIGVLGLPTPTDERSGLTGCAAAWNAFKAARPIELRRP